MAAHAATLAPEVLSALETYTDTVHTFLHIKGELLGLFNESDIPAVVRVLGTFLDDGFLPRLPQRLVSYLWLFALSKTPFGAGSHAVLHDILQELDAQDSHSLSPLKKTECSIEKFFLLALMSNFTDMIFRESPSSLVSTFLSSYLDHLTKLAVKNQTFLLFMRTAKSELSQSCRGFDKANISPFLFFDRSIPIADNPVDMSVRELVEAPRFHPSWARPPPPISDPMPEEMFWARPPVAEHRLRWDDNLPHDVNDHASLDSVLQQSFVQQLPPGDTLRIRQALQSDDSEMHVEEMLTVDSLPVLMDFNPVVAMEAVLYLARNGVSVQEFVEVLVQLPMSLHTVETLNRLVSTTEVSKVNIHMFISNCIRECESTEDPQLQARMVRLLCVFVQSLLRNGIVTAEEVKAEVQQFCAQFSHVSAAASLFGVLSSIETDES